MRQLLPEVLDPVDPVAIHAGLARPAPTDRPYVLMNMIASVDGATVVDGVSGGLGGDGDLAVFRALRALPDVILVGRGTADAERYRAPRASPEVQEARVARSQSPLPRLAVVSGRLNIDLSLEMFTEPADPRPLVVTAASAPTNRRKEVEAVAEILVAGGETVDLRAALAQLHQQGVRVVLCEGGPSLNGALLADDLIDELCLSLSPALAGGDSERIVSNAPGGIRPMHLERVFEQDGALFLRYLRSPVLSPS